MKTISAIQNNFCQKCFIIWFQSPPHSLGVTCIWFYWVQVVWKGPGHEAHSLLHGCNYCDMFLFSLSSTNCVLSSMIDLLPPLFFILSFFFVCLFVIQTHTILHVLTQSCLSVNKIADGSQHPTVETCNDSALQKWRLRNYTRTEVFRNIFGNTTDYFL